MQFNKLDKIIEIRNEIIRLITNIKERDFKWTITFINVFCKVLWIINCFKIFHFA